MQGTLTIARRDETKSHEGSGPVLVAFSTNAGSTKDVAAAIAEELNDGGTDAVALHVDEVDDMREYSAAVVGGPMIVGWHREAVKFVRRFEAELSEMPVAVFFTAMYVTETGDSAPGELDVLVDESISHAPAGSASLSFKERMTTVPHYLKPVMKLRESFRPLGVAFFAGKLDYRVLSFLQMVFVMVIVGARPGDYRDWKLIRRWARDIRPRLETGAE